MKPEISEDAKQKAIKMYRKGELTVVEIANLVGLSKSGVYSIIRKCFKDGTLQPRQGSNEQKRKFTKEQEQEIARDYYENNLSWSKVKAKWNIHPVQMQRIREEYKDIYGIKDNAPNYLRDKNSQ